MSDQSWFVYVVRCADGSLYTGIALDVAARIEKHNAGKGARYTRGRGPVEVLATSKPMEHGDALRFEAKVKRAKGGRKVALVECT